MTREKETETYIMEPEEPLTRRALKTSVWVAACTTLYLFCAARYGLAWGFLIGALLSLFSLFSLTVAVPMLCRPGASRFAQGMLSLTLLMKLPLYMVGLCLITHLGRTAPMGAGLGIALVPMVITLKALGSLIKLPAPAPAAETETPADAEVLPESLIHSQRPARALRTRHVEPIRERG